MRNGLLILSIIALGLAGCAGPWCRACPSGGATHCTDSQCNVCFEKCLSPPDPWLAGYHETVWQPLESAGHAINGMPIEELVPIESPLPTMAPLRESPLPETAGEELVPIESQRPGQTIHRGHVEPSRPPHTADWEVGPREYPLLQPSETAASTHWAGDAAESPIGEGDVSLPTAGGMPVHRVRGGRRITPRSHFPSPNLSPEGRGAKEEVVLRSPLTDDPQGPSQRDDGADQQATFDRMVVPRRTRRLMDSWPGRRGAPRQEPRSVPVQEPGEGPDFDSALHEKAAEAILLHEPPAASVPIEPVAYESFDQPADASRSWAASHGTTDSIALRSAAEDEPCDPEPADEPGDGHVARSAPESDIAVLRETFAGHSSHKPDPAAGREEVGVASGSDAVSTGLARLELRSQRRGRVDGSRTSADAPRHVARGHRHDNGTDVASLLSTVRAHYESPFEKDRMGMRNAE